MADIYFRTALGGYNKQDVMRFIEKLNCEQSERTSELTEQNKILQNDAKKLSEDLAKLRERCEKLEEEVRILSEKAEINSEKASKYDDMQASFADIMLNAEHEAQKKIQDAEIEANRIIKSAREEIERKQKELDDMKSEFSDTFIENKQIIERSKGEFSGVFEKICSSIESIYSKVTNACKRADNDK